MITPERRVEIASQLANSAFDIQKLSHKKIPIIIPALPTLVIALSAIGYNTIHDPKGLILAGTTALLYTGFGEYCHIVGRMTEGRSTLPISSWFLPKVISTGINGLANLIRSADKQKK